MKKICFFARGGQNKLYGEMSKLLDKSVFSSCFIVHNDKEEKRLVDLQVTGTVYNLTDFIKKNWGNQFLLDSIDIAQKEQEYHIDSIWFVFYADRFLIDYKTEDAIKFIKLHIVFFENILNKEKPNCHVNEEISLFSSFLFYLIGCKKQCYYIGFAVPSINANSKVHFVNSSVQNFYCLDRNYLNQTFDDTSKARTFIKDFLIKKNKPSYMFITGKYPKLRPQYFLDFVKYLLSIILLKKNKYDYEHYRKHDIHIYKFVNYLKYRLQKKYYSMPNNGDKYLLFPLHYQPEGTTLVYAPFYEKQLYAIDLIAKSIPGNMILYVKEHYAELGHRENGFYKKLKNYPNVRLINPWCDSHGLIQDAEGVITLTSTMGWEALFYQKPVFILGEVFYQTFKYANKIENIKNLAPMIKKVLSNPIDEDTYQKELEKYVQAYLDTMGDGNYILGEPAVETSENIKKLTVALIEQISYFEKNNDTTV